MTPVLVEAAGSLLVSTSAAKVHAVIPMAVLKAKADLKFIFGLDGILNKTFKRSKGFKRPPVARGNIEHRTPNAEHRMNRGWFSAQARCELPSPSPRPSPLGEGGLYCAFGYSIIFDSIQRLAVHEIGGGSCEVYKDSAKL